MHAGLFLALKGNAGPDDLGQTVNVHCLQSQLCLDLLTHFLCPGFCTENTNLQSQFALVNAHFCHSLCQEQRIGGGAADKGGLEVPENVDLTLGIAHRNRHNSHASLFGTAMHAQSAGEQTIAVGNVDNILLGSPCCGQCSCAAFRPGIQILPGIAHYDLLASGAAGGMQTHDLAHGHCEHTVGIGIPQILFISKGQLVQIIHTADIRRRNPSFIHTLPVQGYPFVHSSDCLGQAEGLERPHFIQRCAFHTFIPIH